VSAEGSLAGRDLERALARAQEGRRPAPAEAEVLLHTPPDRLAELLAAARALCEQGHGRRITFSAKVFVPLTTLCRDYCG
jgi:2-iminoacetate synthase ThiH